MYMHVLYFLFWRLCMYQVRDDNQKLNPSLQAFEDLTDKMREYDYQMAVQTLKTLVALGYQMSVEELDPSQLKYLDLSPAIYQMSNGYLPRPLNLDAVSMPDNLGDLVEKLAENAHNIWASAKIKEGWTFGKSDVSALHTVCCFCCLLFSLFLLFVVLLLLFFVCVFVLSLFVCLFCFDIVFCCLFLFVFVVVVCCC